MDTNGSREHTDTLTHATYQGTNTYDDEDTQALSHMCKPTKSKPNIENRHFVPRLNRDSLFAPHHETPLFT